jgi:hypothetical protein
MKKNEEAGFSAVNHAFLHCITGAAMVRCKRDVAPSESYLGVTDNTISEGYD